MNISKRPHQSGRIGRAAVAGHVAIYALMVTVPAVRILAASGSTRGFTYLGFQIFPARDAEVAWMHAAAKWAGFWHS